MFAFVVLAGKNVSRMTYFVWGGT